MITMYGVTLRGCEGCFYNNQMGGSMPCGYDFCPEEEEEEEDDEYGEDEC